MPKSITLSLSTLRPSTITEIVESVGEDLTATQWEALSRQYRELTGEDLTQADGTTPADEHLIGGHFIGVICAEDGTLRKVTRGYDRTKVWQHLEKLNPTGTSFIIEADVVVDIDAT